MRAHRTRQTTEGSVLKRGVTVFLQTAVTQNDHWMKPRKAEESGAGRCLMRQARQATPSNSSSESQAFGPQRCDGGNDGEKIQRASHRARHCARAVAYIIWGCAAIFCGRPIESLPRSPQPHSLASLTTAPRPPPNFSLNASPRHHNSLPSAISISPLRSILFLAARWASLCGARPRRSVRTSPKQTQLPLRARPFAAGPRSQVDAPEPPQDRHAGSTVTF
jgi:hypothetical protein